MHSSLILILFTAPYVYVFCNSRTTATASSTVFPNLLILSPVANFLEHNLDLSNNFSFAMHQTTGLPRHHLLIKTFHSPTSLANLKNLPTIAQLPYHQVILKMLYVLCHRSYLKPCTSTLCHVFWII